MDDPGRKTAILDTMCSAPQYVMISLFEEFAVWDGAEIAAGLKVPYLYIAASVFRTDLNILREICPRLTTAQVVGSGHFVTLEVPQQVNPMLERFFPLR